MQGAASPERVEEALGEILERPEFDDRPSRFEQLLDRLGEAFEVEGVAAAGEVLFWIVLLLLTVAAVFLFTRLLATARRGERGGRTALPRGTPVRARVAALRSQAREARARGDYRTALERSLFALILGLGQRGELEYRDAWTNRELLRRGKPAREARELLAPLVAELEPKEFGRLPATAADVDRLEELCERYLGPFTEAPA